MSCFACFPRCRRGFGSPELVIPWLPKRYSQSAPRENFLAKYTIFLTTSPSIPLEVAHNLLVLDGLVARISVSITVSSTTLGLISDTLQACHSSRFASAGDLGSIPSRGDALNIFFCIPGAGEGVVVAIYQHFRILVVDGFGGFSRCARALSYIFEPHDRWNKLQIIYRTLFCSIPCSVG